MASLASQAISGDVELMSALKKMRTTAVRRSVALGMRKSGQMLVKRVKASVPSRYKGVRKAIGYRMAKTKFTGGVPGAKIGAGVGKRSKKAKTTVKKREGRKGVGFDAPNIHWWFLGTDQRETGTKRARVGGKRGRKGFKGQAVRIATGKVRRRTGSMPAQSEPISVIVSRHNAETMRVLRTWIWVGIKKEVAKGKAF